TVTNIDLAVKVQMAAERTEAGARALAVAQPRLPDHDNAAPVYQQAFDALLPREVVSAEKSEEWFGQSVLGRRRPTVDPKSKELRAFLDRRRAGLTLLRRAADMPDCSFDRDFSRGFDLLLPEIEHM